MTGVIVSIVQTIIDFFNGEADVSLSTVFSFMRNCLFNVIYDFMYDFLTGTKQFFVRIGRSFSNIFTGDKLFFDEYFFVYIIGLIIGIYIMKIIINATIELISKFIDPM